MRRHHTKEKGDLGVVCAVADMVRKGFIVLNPMTEHAPFDLVAYDHERFYRVQVKYRAVVNGTIRLPFTSSWADRHGTHTLHMDKGSVDVVCIYCPDTDRCYYIDPRQHRRAVTLRLAPTRNRQAKGVLLADQFLKFPTP
jgi:hypothetical protein